MEFDLTLFRLYRKADMHVWHKQIILTIVFPKSSKNCKALINELLGGQSASSVWLCLVVSQNEQLTYLKICYVSSLFLFVSNGVKIFAYENKFKIYTQKLNKVCLWVLRLAII